MPSKMNNSKSARGKNKRAGNEKKRSTAEEMEVLAKALHIKPKTKEFVDKLLNNPKMNQTQAYIDTHKTMSRDTAKANASKLLAKSNVKIYKDSAIGKAKRVMVQLMDSQSENIQFKAASDVLDRTEGKAIQKNELTSTVIRVELDLGGVRLGNHYLPSPSTPALPE